VIRCDLLRGKFAEKGYSQSQIAKMLGITPKTFYDKMKRGVFRSDEMQKMVDFVGIQNPIEIFFAQEHTRDVSSENEQENERGSE
jgi:predicted transcriptional regulator